MSLIFFQEKKKNHPLIIVIYTCSGQNLLSKASPYAKVKAEDKQYECYTCFYQFPMIRSINKLSE